MPTYEYQCLSCGHRFEVLQKMTEPPKDKCPKCKKRVKRLITSGVGLIFKGSGFYATDYRKAPQDKSLPPKGVECPKRKEGCDGCGQK